MKQQTNIDPTTVATVWHSMQTICKEMRHLVTAAEREEQQLAVIENRADITPVRQMRVVSAVVGIVGQEDVAGMDVIFEHLDQFLDRKRRAEKLVR